MVGHGGSSAGSYLADPTSPIPSHCASIVVTSTVRVKEFNKEGSFSCWSSWLPHLEYLLYCLSWTSWVEVVVMVMSPPADPLHWSPIHLLPLSAQSQLLEHAQQQSDECWVIVRKQSSNNDTENATGKASCTFSFLCYKDRIKGKDPFTGPQEFVVGYMSISHYDEHGVRTSHHAHCCI